MALYVYIQCASWKMPFYILSCTSCSSNNATFFSISRNSINFFSPPKQGLLEYVFRSWMFRGHRMDIDCVRIHHRIHTYILYVRFESYLCRVNFIKFYFYSSKYTAWTANKSWSFIVINFDLITANSHILCL